MSDNKVLIEKLNDILRQEHACMIRYATHAAVITGPSAESVKARLQEISDDERDHAVKLRDRIVALGGKPSMGVHEKDLVEAYDLETILKINIKEEADAIKQYQEILKMIPESDVILYETIRDIIEDEQEHQEELNRLR